MRGFCRDAYEALVKFIEMCKAFTMFCCSENIEENEFIDLIYRIVFKLIGDLDYNLTNELENIIDHCFSIEDWIGMSRTE